MVVKFLEFYTRKAPGYEWRKWFPNIEFQFERSFKGKPDEFIEFLSDDSMIKKKLKLTIGQRWYFAESSMRWSVSVNLQRLSFLVIEMSQHTWSNEAILKLANNDNYVDMAQREFEEWFSKIERPLKRAIIKCVHQNNCFAQAFQETKGLSPSWVKYLRNQKCVH